MADGRVGQGTHAATGAPPVERRKYSKDSRDTSQDRGKSVWVPLTGHIWDKLNVGTKGDSNDSNMLNKVVFGAVLIINRLLFR